jgi:hypothetical protein
MESSASFSISTPLTESKRFTGLLAARAMQRRCGPPDSATTLTLN